MSFKETILFMLNMVKKTMQVELNDFFETVLKKDYTVSKQAYSEVRQKIDPKAFIELNDRINEVIYHEYNEFELWKGYRLSAIDGSVLEIPDTEMLRNDDGKVLKHEYKTNVNILIGSLKDKFILMMLEESVKRRNKIFKELMDTISRNCVPIRPDRSNERRTKKSSRKYRTNQKRCL